MPPTAQRTIYVRRAVAESGDLGGGPQIDDARARGGGQEGKQAAVGSGAGVSGRIGGKDAAGGGWPGKAVKRQRHHVRDWRRERSAKATSAEERSLAEDLEAGNDSEVTSSNSKHLARQWSLERYAKYKAKGLKRQESAIISTMGMYTLIGPAPEHLDRQAIKRGLLSRFSSTEVPAAVGFSTITTGTQSSDALFTYDPITTAATHHPSITGLSATFNYAPTMKVEDYHTTIKGPPSTAAPSVSHGKRRVEHGLPTSYVVSWYAILALLSTLWTISIVLYFVNFPPKFWLQRRSAREHCKPRYAKVSEDSSSDRTRDQIGSAAFTTSSDTPSSTSPSLRTRVQRPRDHTDPDVVGLGIELSEIAPKRQKSFINSNDKPLPGAPGKASTPHTAPLPSNSQFDHLPTITPSHTQDLEDGLTIPTREHDSTYLSPHRLSPYDSSQSSPSSASSSRSPSPHRVLKKVGDGIEYFAGRAARMMHDQVKEDPEEDLFLPVRHSERERPGEVLKKAY
ncbi:hypothetical protein DOTSEDRAFT_35870 [Dothistroma septosporum NZE10]|uniref:Uncharacterized protein n=1 Tax=Dothistroma septosporum (strain NZE10 / CBS 128990) TaxID=675120 RepID=M2Y5X0_DOTSN|nr:hypothetical protein DOTSEDRAFT_35870 [Dothistroma septosporum NZE10]